MVGWIMPLLTIAGSVLQSQSANQASSNAADAQTAGLNASNALTSAVYNDQRALTTPLYQNAGAASNMLAAYYGLPGQNYTVKPSTVTATGVGAGGASGNGATTPNAFGMGTINNADVSRLDAAANVLGNGYADPVLTAINGAVGFDINDPLGLFGRPDNNGDARWGTTTANSDIRDPTIDYNALYASAPDIKTLQTGKYAQGVLKGFDFNGDGTLGNDEAAAAWYHKIGPENRDWRTQPGATYQGQTFTVPKLATATATGTGTGTGATTATGTTTPGQIDWVTGNMNGNTFNPLQNFYDSAQGQAAIKGFSEIDIPEVNAGYGAAGMMLSGAQRKALQDRGTARSGTALNNYLTGLSNIANGTTTAMQSLNTSSQNYGNAASENALAQANVLATAYGQRAQNNRDMITGIGTAIGDSGWFGT